jgi:hypothetical protein
MATVGNTDNNRNIMFHDWRMTMSKAKKDKKDEKPMPGKPGKKGC